MTTSMETEENSLNISNDIFTVEESLNRFFEKNPEIAAETIEFVHKMVSKLNFNTRHELDGSIREVETGDIMPELDLAIWPSGAPNSAAAPDAASWDTIIDIFDENDTRVGVPWMPEDFPPAVNPVDEINFGTKVSNDIILGITGQAAIALVSSSSSDSLFLHTFVAATGIGFLGSFLANYFKKPKISSMLSKIGAIGTASAVITVLGMYLPKDVKWNLNIVATVVGGLTTAIMVVIS